MSGGEDEFGWGHAFRASAAPDLVAALTGCETQDVLDLLGQPRYASFESDELAHIIREAESIPELLRRRYESAATEELKRATREADSAILRKLWSWPV